MQIQVQQNQQKELSALMGYTRFDPNMDEKAALSSAQAQIYKTVFEKMLLSMTSMGGSQEPTEQQRRTFSAMGALLGQQLAQAAPMEDPRMQRALLLKDSPET